MKKNELKISSNLQKQTQTAIVSIVIFVLVYLLMLILAVGLTILCVLVGIRLIQYYPTVVTIILGIGLSTMGIVILFFLLKFITFSHKIDRSYLVEITQMDEPKLFDVIAEIVKEVDTQFPKRVYLSNEVNASVFYDSNFWSMFFPVKKNLQIGLGLVNTTSKSEFRAILSHEFGHFSQKSMKVGSYVYNVNQVIYNLLYQNESYDKVIRKLSNVNGYFMFFNMIALKVVGGIQWLLKKLYEYVNIRYLELSREMEFHADEVAANVTGFEPLKQSLLRLPLANFSFNNVVSFYESRISQNQVTTNIYKDQFVVLHFLANENKIQIHDGLPQVEEADFNKFNKSKLVVVDQWASHPSTEDRIAHLEKNGLHAEQLDAAPANAYFMNSEVIQEKLTKKLFEQVTFTETCTYLSNEEFEEEFTKDYFENTFSKLYNGYYDDKHPIPFDVNSLSNTEHCCKELDDLFSDKMIDLIYTEIALKNDIAAISQIADKSYRIRTFDYDGRKFTQKESKLLLEKLEISLKDLNQQVEENDIQIFHFFHQLEQNTPNEGQLENLYNDFFDFDKSYQSRFEIYQNLLNELQFVNIETPVEEIQANFKKVDKLELNFKQAIVELIEHKEFDAAISSGIREDFESYLSKKMSYFSFQRYNDVNLEILFNTLNQYFFVLSRIFFLLKKKLLSYQAELVQTQSRESK